MPATSMSPTGVGIGPAHGMAPGTRARAREKKSDTTQRAMVEVIFENVSLVHQHSSPTLSVPTGGGGDEGGAVLSISSALHSRAGPRRPPPRLGHVSWRS